MPDAQETRPHAVVVNDEEQYSIWPAGRDLPAVSRRRDLGLVTNRHQVVLRSLPTASLCH